MTPFKYTPTRCPVCGWSISYAGHTVVHCENVDCSNHVRVIEHDDPWWDLPDNADEAVKPVVAGPEVHIARQQVFHEVQRRVLEALKTS